jgi:5-(carboxyamino)imidazole ribonucleotide mutase
VSIGGARNAGLLAVRILAVSDSALRGRIIAFQDQLAESVLARDADLKDRQGKVTGQ